MSSNDAKALRAKHLSAIADFEKTEDSAAHKRTAVVVGAAGGIGEACAHRLAEAGFSVVAVGRDRPGRAEAVVSGLEAKGSAEGQRHEFRACDAFSLSGIKDCADGIAKDRGTIDAVVLSQGMATVQNFTPTAEGNDEKITLHFWSRAAMSACLLPSLRRSAMPGGAVVVSILSGGVHGVYNGLVHDPELQNTYSIPRAADMAGYYNDLFFDALGRRKENEKLNFVHAAPGFVNSNWGTELPWYARALVRCAQPLLGKKMDDCAEFMVDPILKSATGTKMIERPGGVSRGVYIMNEDATTGNLTNEHTYDAMERVWNITAKVLKMVGIDINEKC